MRNELKIEKEADYGEVTPVAATTDLGELRRKAAKCQACPLFRNATQTVFGEGGAGVVVFIGEQPGDQEDKVGKPFVGPAGQILDRALQEVGIDRSQCYSRTRSNISSGNRAASGGSTKNLVPVKLKRVARG